VRENDYSTPAGNAFNAKAAASTRLTEYNDLLLLLLVRGFTPPHLSITVRRRQRYYKFTRNREALDGHAFWS